MTTLPQHHPFPLPGDRPRYPRDRLFDVRHIRLEVAIDLEARRLWGTCSTTLAAINDGLSRLEFDCVDLAVKSVSLSGGVQLPYEVTDGRLRIDSGSRRAAGEELTVAVEYECSEPRRGLYFIAPDEAYPDRPLQAWTQGQDEDSRHWFPCYDFPNEQATSEVIVTVPEPLTVISNGLLVSVEAAGEAGGASGGPKMRTFRWRQDVPHVSYLLSLVVGEFAKVGDQFEGTPVDYYVPTGQEDDGRR